MRWVEHVARVGETRNKYKILMGNLKGKYYLGETGEKFQG
jgi:hypothetical protein